MFAPRARPSPLNGIIEYKVFALGEETSVQAVVGSIVGAFRRLKKREMSARSYALHNVCPPTFLFSHLILCLNIATHFAFIPPLARREHRAATPSPWASTEHMLTLPQSLQDGHMRIFTRREYGNPSGAESEMHSLGVSAPDHGDS